MRYLLLVIALGGCRWFDRQERIEWCLEQCNHVYYSRWTTHGEDSDDESLRQNCIATCEAEHGN